jgi:putative FmdB family regulatory protein
MPIYEYRRPDGSTFEIMQSFTDERLTHDPETGVEVHRVLHAPAVHFKGKGFYNTDYGTRKRQRENAASSAESSSDSSGEGSGSSGEDSGSAKDKSSSSEGKGATSSEGKGAASNGKAKGEKSTPSKSPAIAAKS